MWFADKVGKYHSHIKNTCTHPIVAIFGKDGREDNAKKCVIKLKPGEGSNPPNGYHLDWLIRQDCHVIECRTRFQSSWTIIPWEEFCRKIHPDKETGKDIIRRIEESFGNEAPPPCGKGGTGAIA